MARDRLSEINQARQEEQQDDYISIPLSNLREEPRVDEFYHEVQDLTDSIERLMQNVEEVKTIHSTILSTPTVDEEVKIRLEKINTDIKLDATKIKAKLKVMDEQTQHLAHVNPMSAEHRIRKTQHNMLAFKFHDVVNDYQSSSANHKEKLKDRLIRQVEITGRETDENEIEEMIESNNLAIFTRDIVTDTQQMKQALAEIESRHNDIVKLEKNLKELRDLFVDMAILVEGQGEMVDRIENHVQESKGHVEKARDDVNQAIAYKSKAMKKKLLCMICLVIIIGAVVFSTLIA